MSGHLDLDALADLLAGEGDDAQVDHLAGCGACSAALVDLERASAEVGAALAALPAPVVPDGLAARVDAALRAASRDDTPVPVPGLRSLPVGDERAAPGGRAGRRTPRRRRSVLLAAAAAAAAVVVVGGAAVTAVLPGTGTSGDTLSATAGRTAPPAAPERAADVPEPAAAGSAPRELGPGERGLSDALPELLASARSDGRRNDPAGPAGTSRLRDPGALAACVSALPGPAAEVLALEHASYEGEPALVVVRPAAAPDRVRVAVVGARCGTGDADARLITELPRP